MVSSLSKSEHSAQTTVFLYQMNIVQWTMHRFWSQKWFHYLLIDGAIQVNSVSLCESQFIDWNIKNKNNNSYHTEFLKRLHIAREKLSEAECFTVRHQLSCSGKLTLPVLPLIASVTFLSTSFTSHRRAAGLRAGIARDWWWERLSCWRRLS